MCERNYERPIRSQLRHGGREQTTSRFGFKEKRGTGRWMEVSSTGR